MLWGTGPLPDPGPEEVLVAVEAIGVNFADTMVRRGEYRRDQPLTFIPGFEVAGRVVRDATGGLTPGAPVIVFTEHGGGYADHVVAAADHVFPVLDGIDMVHAASVFTQGVTAWYAVGHYGRITPGMTVLVHAAAGGLGSLCVQLAAARGAEVIGAASTAAKRDLVLAHGARHAISADPETLTAELRERTAGRGVDVVIDGVGGPVFAPTLRGLAFNGTYIVVGSASQQPAMLDTRALMPRGQTVVGFVVARVAAADPDEPAAAVAAVQRAMLVGDLRPELHVLAASELARAHELIESRRLTGKLVLVWDGD